MSEGIRFAFIIVSCLVIVIGNWSHSSCNSKAPKAPVFKNHKERHDWVISRFLPWMEQYEGHYFNVPRSDGEFLYRLVQGTKRKQCLEMGSANGYSAIWIGLGLEKTAGKLITVEIDPDIAALCQSNLREVLLTKTVTCLIGDALLVTKNLNGPFDLLFVDVGPMDVLSFVKVAEPKLSDDSIIVLHNLGFGGSYKKFFNYARSKGWIIKSVKPKNGLGFYLVTKIDIVFDIL